MRDFAETCRRIDRRRHVVLGELHPELFKRVQFVLTDLGGRLTPWEGYRDKLGQENALRRGSSEASWLASPHNYKPSLAIDVVLDPRFVQVGPHPEAPQTPWLWEINTHSAQQAWEDLEAAAFRHGLERVNVRGKRDRPHLQLPGWRTLIPH